MHNEVEWQVLFIATNDADGNLRCIRKRIPSRACRCGRDPAARSDISACERAALGPSSMIEETCTYSTEPVRTDSIEESHLDETEKGRNPANEIFTEDPQEDGSYLCKGRRKFPRT